MLLTLLVATLDDLEFDFTELLFTAVVDFFPDDFSGDCCCFLGLLTLLFTSALDLAEEVGDTLFITAFFLTFFTVFLAFMGTALVTFLAFEDTFALAFFFTAPILRAKNSRKIS